MTLDAAPVAGRPGTLGRLLEYAAGQAPADVEMPGDVLQLVTDVLTARPGDEAVATAIWRTAAGPAPPRRARAGQMGICWDLLTRVTGGSVLTEAASGVRSGSRRARALPAFPCHPGEVSALRHGGPGRGRPRRVREYEELGFTATLEFEQLRSDGSLWPGRLLQTRV
ncbi:hypothetical protein [Streptomyces sp. NPDC041003]|uniref:hypothetical protein n=1 Tax=Streptomyces sp. NPDC041003 TaxID=3155730 RepID=UPI0033DD734E